MDDSEFPVIHQQYLKHGPLPLAPDQSFLVRSDTASSPDDILVPYMRDSLMNQKPKKYLKHDRDQDLFFQT